MKYLVLVAALAMFAFTTPAKKNKVIFFGDSITQAAVKGNGYIVKLDSIIKKEGLGESFELAGAGIGGNKVYDLYLRMETDVLEKNPDIVFIYVGINDVWHKSSSGTGTDAPKFIGFYKAIIKKLQEKNIRVVVCTPSVIGERNDFSNEQDGDLNHYSNIIRNIAKESNLPVVDLRKAFVEYEKANNPTNQEKGILTTDRVHLNDAGNLFVAGEMWKVLKTLK
ncbi:MAG: G-D-S-L family lipolytic protein [Chitinophagaceae bacterium]|nr:G-D-S-L family lipolytic protein [Chitinophagaceae bacterium]